MTQTIPQEQYQWRDSIWTRALNTLFRPKGVSLAQPHVLIFGLHGWIPTKWLRAGSWPRWWPPHLL